MRAFLVASHQPGISDDIDEDSSCSTPFRTAPIRSVVRRPVVDTDHHHRRNNCWAATAIVAPKDCSRQGQAGKCKACTPTEQNAWSCQSTLQSWRVQLRRLIQQRNGNTRIFLECEGMPIGMPRTVADWYPATSERTAGRRKSLPSSRACRRCRQNPWRRCPNCRWLRNRPSATGRTRSAAPRTRSSGRTSARRRDRDCARRPSSPAPA